MRWKGRTSRGLGIRRVHVVKKKEMATHSNVLAW